MSQPMTPEDLARELETHRALLELIQDQVDALSCELNDAIKERDRLQDKIHELEWEMR